MKVLVMGAGVIGVTTAYCLLKDGHEVTVVERNDGAAEETSANNAGLIAPGHAYAWASPKAPAMLLKSLIVRDTEAAQELGALELDEEDLALCSFVCNGKYNYGPHLRKALDEIEAYG